MRGQSVEGCVWKWEGVKIVDIRTTEKQNWWRRENERCRQKKKIFEEIITENFPNLGKETRIQVQEVQGILNKMNTKKPTLKHFIIKLAKIKEKILKVARKKQVVTYKCPHIGQSADFWAGITILKSVKKILRQKE